MLSDDHPSRTDQSPSLRSLQACAIYGQLDEGQSAFWRRIRWMLWTLAAGAFCPESGQFDPNRSPERRADPCRLYRRRFLEEGESRSYLKSQASLDLAFHVLHDVSFFWRYHMGNLNRSPGLQDESQRQEDLSETSPQTAPWLHRAVALRRLAYAIFCGSPSNPTQNDFEGLLVRPCSSSATCLWAITTGPPRYSAWSRTHVSAYQ